MCRFVALLGLLAVLAFPAVAGANLADPGGGNGPCVIYIWVSGVGLVPIGRC